MQVVNHYYCLRHYLKKDFRAPFSEILYYKKAILFDKLWIELRQYIYTPVIFPGEDNGIYIYRRKIFLLCLMPCKEKIPREERCLGGIILPKMGLGNLLGKCLKMSSLTTSSMLKLSSPGKKIPPH